MGLIGHDDAQGQALQTVSHKQRSLTPACSARRTWMYAYSVQSCPVLYHHTCKRSM